MTTPSRERGAVNILFLIVTLVIAIVGWVLWYVEFSEKETLVAAKVSAEAGLQEELNSSFKYKQAYDTLAKVVGISKLPEAQPAEELETYLEPVKTSIAQVERTISEMRNLFNAGESATKVVDIVSPAQAVIDALESEKAQLARDLAQAKRDRDTAEQANDQIIGAHTKELSGKNSELGDLRQRHAAQLQAVEDRSQDSSSKLQELTERYDATLTDHRTNILSLEDKTNKLEGEVRDVKDDEKIERERDLPDGKVIDADARTSSCWIDLGSRHFVRRGTRFNTYGLLKGGVRQHHGYVVVRDIERDRSYCTFEAGAAPERGDFITNPYYARDAKKHFFFLGNLPGRFDNQQASRIIRQFGGVVDEALTVRTDFVVLGDNPEPIEDIDAEADANWFKKTDGYNDAIRWGIEMIRARDLETYLQY